MAPLTEVEDLLSTRIGFDVETVGTQAVRIVITRCMHEAGFSDSVTYARKLSDDSEAWNCLVERVVIPETWFFRDIAPFELVADLARAHARRASGRALRVLSCPCSSGEEPYSVVMAMLHAGVPAEAFTVDAVDLSRYLLEWARGGRYGVRSFRTAAPWYRAAYFDSEPEGWWRLRNHVLSMVRFSHGNLIESDFIENKEPYDVVFCRNLLIYFHQEARLRAITAVNQLLAPGGVLVLGHAEAAFAREQGFTPIGSAGAFAFEKPSSRVLRKLAPPEYRHKEVSRVFLSPPPAVAVGAPPPVSISPSAAGDGSPLEAEPSPLTLARQLGNSGQVQDALKLCRQYLGRVPDSADAHFLFGVLHNALGHTELAVSSFRKALYLDPNHRDALLHLALKREAVGDKSGAALLRARALAQADPRESGERGEAGGQ